MPPARVATAIRAALILSILAAMARSPCAMAAENRDRRGEPLGGRVGGRVVYFRPGRSDSGSLSGGGQLRAHITRRLAVEGSADLRQNSFDGVLVDIYPVQLSLLSFIRPRATVSPYLLGGGGWYYTHVRGSRGSGSANRFGVHAGAGIEAVLDRHWTIDGSWRYLWMPLLSIADPASPSPRRISDSGFMLTTALNYSF